MMMILMRIGDEFIEDIFISRFDFIIVYFKKGIEDELDLFLGIEIKIYFFHLFYYGWICLFYHYLDVFCYGALFILAYQLVVFEFFVLVVKDNFP